ncbi:MAG: AI-2E family transporter [Verrucomicrobia bacterium]|nr:AI-2E family transporter [Verrucomicrobiota bacterium]
MHHGPVVTIADTGGAPESTPRIRVPDLLRRPFDVRSVAMTGLFVLAIFYTIYFTRSVLLPVVLAMLLSYLFRPIVRAFLRVRIPTPLTAALVLIALISLISYGVSALATPIAAWVQQVPAGLQQLQHKLVPVRKSIAQVAQASGELEKLATPEVKTKPTPVELQRHPLNEILYSTPEFVASLVLTLILLYFLLAYDGVFAAKLVKILPTLSDKKRAVAILNDIEAQISRYLFTVTIINLCLGCAVGTTVGILGLRNPLMWAALVAALNFVPYLGALTGILCMTIGAVLSFDSLGFALIFPAVYLGFGTLEGNFVTPWVMGRSLTLNPVLILLSIAFWGWMWGIVGIILAVPILAAFKIFCAHVEQMAPLAEFLS